MEQREYHCFLAGLPGIRLNDSALWTTPPEFIEVLGQELHPNDFEMVRLLLLRYDHDNLVRFLMGKDLVHEGVAVYSADEFTRQKVIFGAIIPEEDILPPYMSDVLRQYSGSEEALNDIECRRRLHDGYYGWAMDNGSRFIKGYTEFEYNLSNMLTYLINSHTGSNDPGEGIPGRGSFARHLQEIPGKNLVKDHEFEYFDDILRIEGSSSLAAAEMEYDRLRWDEIEKLAAFEYFTADAVLAYLQKLLIASRWDRMTETEGRGVLIDTIDNALGKSLQHLQT